MSVTGVAVPDDAAVLTACGCRVYDGALTETYRNASPMALSQYLQCPRKKSPLGDEEGKAVSAAFLSLPFFLQQKVAPSHVYIAESA